MKKTFSVVLALLLFINIFNGYSLKWFKVHAGSNINFTVGQVAGVQGDAVTVNIDISGNSNIAAATLRLSFDSTKLDYVSSEKGSALESGMTDIYAVGSTITLAYINQDGLVSSGTTMTVQFNIKAGVTAQTIPLDFQVLELMDLNENNLSSSVSQGSIVVNDIMLGDVNRDGRVSAVDALMALQISSGRLTTTLYTSIAADVNWTGSVTAVDALEILQLVSGKITTFGIQPTPIPTATVAPSPTPSATATPVLNMREKYAQLGINANEMVALWSFDEEVNGKITDMSNNKINLLTNNRFALETGISGKAIKISATDRIEADNTAVMSGLSQATFNVWVNLSDFRSENMLIFAKDEGDAPEYRMIFTGADGSGHAIIHTASQGWYDGTNMIGFISGATSANITNKWIMLSTTYDGNKITTYFNGIKINQSVQMSGNIISSNAKFYIGKSIINQMNSINGLVDDLAILNRAMTTAEIAKLYELYTGKKIDIDTTPRTIPDTSKGYEVAAYYFPQWHVDPVNELHYGTGWTEWELIKKAIPRFPGHDQPKVPLWGYADEANPLVMAQKIDAASQNGVDAFIFDWYWSDNGTLLRRALDEGYLKASNKDKVKFSLMWCNHNIFTGPGIVKVATFRAMCDEIIKTYFPDSSYWRVDGKPYFSIYELSNFIETCGNNLAQAKAELDLFRAKARAAGLGEIHINAVDYGIGDIPLLTKLEIGDDNAFLKYLGIDSVTSYTWVHHTNMPTFPTYDYENFYKTALNDEINLSEKYSIPYYPNASMGWDPSPRTDQNAAYTNSGYPYTPILVNNTPALFKTALQGLKQQIDSGIHQTNIITINAWNEWGEGSYLEPDTKNGYGYLNAIRDVFGTN